MMTKTAGRSATIAMLALGTMTASAADNSWNGGYGGFNAGQGSSHPCTTWTPNGSSPESSSLAGLYQPDCSTHGAFIFGAQLGENFQIDRLAWGVEAAVDAWGGSKTTQSAGFDPAPAGGAPAGTYIFSGRRNPDLLGMFTARIGYAGRQWFPYLKGGGIIAGGSQSDTLAYVPEGTTKGAASFNGSKSFASAGWVAGAGAEFGLYGSWSIAAEYLHASLGKGSNSTASCAGTTANCAAFANASLQNGHGGFEANLIRVTVNYWFDYW
jgi:opacity protein-like surface antigen